MTKIVAHYDPPPIPIRDFDWSVIDEDTYDGAPDAGHQIIGHGKTREIAMADYQEQVEDA
jgi:hypothetical protein